MIKKLSFLCILMSLCKGSVHAFSPVRYVQISTNTLSQQTGSINIASATIAGVTASTITASSVTWVNESVTTATLTNVAISSMTTTLPMSGRKITGLANGSAATDAAAFGQISSHLLQLPVCTTVSASSTTSSTTFIPTTLTASITPTSGVSTIIIMASSSLFSTTANDTAEASIFNGATNLAGAPAYGCAVASGAANVNNPCTLLMFQASPGVSLQTYTVKIASPSAGSITWGANGQLQSICIFEVI